MDGNATHSSLNALAFTQGLDPGQLNRIAAIATPVEWGAGQIVVRFAGGPEPWRTMILELPTRPGS
jgi:hypothetical protein